MYAFLRRPRWIAGHLLVVALVALFVYLGFWQLARHEERTAHNTLLEERLAAEPEPLDALLPVPDTGGWEALAYRRVTVEGSYRPDDEVLLSPRSFQGVSGHHVLTPLVTDDGTAVLVDRGWIPFDRDTMTADPAAPTGTVRVTGVLHPDEPAVRFAPAIPDGEAELVSRVDIGRLQEQVTPSLHPVYLQVEEQVPAQPGNVPVLVDPPEPQEGNHLSYAVQWFLFAGVGLVGYPVLLHRTARDAVAPAERRVSLTSASSGP